MKNITNKCPPPNFSASYPHRHAIGAFCLLIILFCLFGLAGCGGDSPSLFSDNIELRFVLEGSNEAIITKSNVTSISAEQDPTANYWRVVLNLDADGTARFSEATASENRGKRIDVILTIKGEDSVLSSPVIYQQITDGVIMISGEYDENSARGLLSRITTGYGLSDWEYYNEWGEFPY